MFQKMVNHFLPPKSLESQAILDAQLYLYLNKWMPDYMETVFTDKMIYMTTNCLKQPWNYTNYSMVIPSTISRTPAECYMYNTGIFNN